MPCGIPVFETGAINRAMRPLQVSTPPILPYFEPKVEALGYNTAMAKDLRSVVKAYGRQQEEEQAAQLAASQNLGYVNLVSYPFVGDVLGIIPQAIATQYQIVAFMKIGTTVRVATTDPFQAGLAEMMTGLAAQHRISFEPFVCSASSIAYALSVYPILLPPASSPSQPIARQESAEHFAQEITNLKDLKDTITKVSTTQLLETIISGAVSLEASDIHFEPMAENVHVRFRIDGKLVPIIELPEKSYKAISSRIKTAARIKIDRKTQAQDGRFTVNVNNTPLDIRANTIPSAYGETIELRLLAFQRFLTMDQLQFNDGTRQAILQAITRSQGLILFTGPTGSGKTTSLYAVLQLLNQPEKKIVTIEDPVEYRIDGIEQVQIDPSSGFDFPQALRGVLRQDPDVIMVGEIRDKETAEIGVNAALTGHLVMSTLHTNSAAAAFARLIEMGVAKYLLADAVILVVAQRLVRRLCPVCGGRGCDTCNQTGYKGRMLIAEHYIPDVQTAELIKREATLGEFQQLFANLGYQNMLQDGLNRVAQNQTTEAEVRSVVG